jgi:hypothetical protein
MLAPHGLEMLHKRRPHAARQHRDSIDARFSIADAHLAALEVDVLDAQRQSLEQSQPRPVQQLADEPHRTMQRTQDRGHLSLRQHDRQPDRTVRPYERRTPFRRSVEHIPVQEEHRAQRLVLRRRADSPLAREHRHKGQHLTLVEPIGMLETAEHDVPPHPADILFLGATAVMARADRARRRSSSLCDVPYGTDGMLYIVLCEVDTIAMVERIW